MMDGWLKTFGLLDEASSLVFYMYVVPVVFCSWCCTQIHEEVHVIV